MFVSQQFRNATVSRMVMLLVGLLVLAGAASAADVDDPAGAPVFSVPADTALAQPFVDRWLLFGPFSFPESAQRASAGCASVDFLADLGGQNQARLTPQTQLTYTDASGEHKTLTACPVQALPSGRIDFIAAFKADAAMDALTNVAAYAFAYLEADSPRTVHCFFGSDDLAQVWLNGELIHTDCSPTGGRACRPREEHFALELHTGLNPLMVKLNQVTGPWEFICELQPPAAAELILVELARMNALGDLQNAELGPRNRWSWIFAPGPFPEIDWRDPDALKPVLGDHSLRVRWFDEGLNEVLEAEKPGRYLAWAETETIAGAKVRRALTFYCASPDWEPWHSMPHLAVPYIENPSIDPAVWQEQDAAIGDWAGDMVTDSFYTQESGARLLAGLSELKPLGHRPTQLDSPQILDEDSHLRLKLRLLGLEGKWPALQPPRRTEPPAPVLRPGTAAEAGMKPDAVERIRAVLRQWYEDKGIPLNVCLARRGIIFYNEAFGEWRGEPVTIDTPFETASTTKAITGLMLAQFVDQGLIALDDPVGKFLPDFPVTGPQVVTIRHCMTHTTGLSGHGNWGGMANPSLENVIANGVEALQPGRLVQYDGMGPDLVGKVLEVVSGKSIYRLMHEYFFQPLGMHDNVTQRDMAYGLSCCAGDMARIGQLLLNKGAYGDFTFFSPSVQESLMPRPIQEVYPAITDATWNYGIGLMWIHPLGGVAGDDLADIDPDDIYFSLRAFGRGGSSGAQMIIDPDHDLVIALARPMLGSDYNDYYLPWLRAIEAGLE